MKLSKFIILLVVVGINLTIMEASNKRVNHKLGRKTVDFSEKNRGSRVAWCRLKFPVSSRLRHDTDWHSHPSGDVKMIRILRDYTDINLKQEWNVVNIDNLSEMCSFPIIFVHGQCPINISKKAENNLKEYVLRGGFLLIDDCKFKNHPIQDLFFRSIMKKLVKVFPGIELKKLTPDHNVFKCNFKLDKWPHMQGKNNGLYAAYYKKRLIAFIYSSDLHCGWVDTGWFSYTKTLNAYRMGVNLYIYAMNN